MKALANQAPHLIAFQLVQTILRKCLGSAVNKLDGASGVHCPQQ